MGFPEFWRRPVSGQRSGSRQDSNPEMPATPPRRAAGHTGILDRPIRKRIRRDPGRSALLLLAIPASVSPCIEWRGQKPAEPVCGSQNRDNDDLNKKEPRAWIRIHALLLQLGGRNRGAPRQLPFSRSSLASTRGVSGVFFQDAPALQSVTRNVTNLNQPSSICRKQR
jgi:hypothetical protein